MKATTIRRLEQILGYGFSTTVGVREYPVIDGVIYTDVFENKPVLPFKHKLAFNGNVNALDYYNEIIVLDKCARTVEIDADWGSSKFDSEIKDLADWLEANPSTDSLDNVGTKSIRIKDTSETFATGEELSDNLSRLLEQGYGYYIRRPLIISFGEQSDAARYF